MLYHIKFRKNRGEETKVNLIEKELLERFVIPYLDGNDIMINGVLITQEQTKSVKITSSEYSLDNIIERIINEDDDEPDPYMTNFLRPSAKSRAMNEQTNVTELYINKVPLKKNNKIRNKDEYISSSRIKELKSIKNATFDLTKLIRLCEEVNINWLQNNYYSVITHVRTILNHVPPIFEVSTFEQVANNYSGGSSFKKSMLHLFNEAKNIADIHLHSQAQKNEVLPNSIQIDFRPGLDLLLSEIIKLNK